MLPPALVGTSDAPSGLGFDERHFPEPALRHVEETALQGPPWNFSPFGGYMIWRLYPRHRVLMDGRIMTAYSMPLVEKAMASDVHPDAFHELDAKYHFEWALCWAGETGTGPGCLPIANSKQWTMTFWDDLSAVYVRRKGSNEAAAREGYRLLRHNVPPEQVLAASIEGGPQSNELVQDATLATRQAPTSPRAWFFAACAAIATRNEEQFETAKQKISTLRPGHASIEALDAAFRMAREKK
jgi:hypothetical protein